MFEQSPFWPARASTTAGQVDALFIFLLILCGVVCLAIFIMIIVFAIRYRRRPGHEAEQIEGSNALEFTWTFIPFGIFLVHLCLGHLHLLPGAYSATGRCRNYTVAQAMDVEVSSTWKGQAEINELHVPSVVTCA